MCAAWCDYFCWSERDEAITFDGIAGYDWTLTEGEGRDHESGNNSGRGRARAVALPAPNTVASPSASTPVAVGVLLLSAVDRVIESLDDSPVRAGKAGDSIVLPVSSDATERSAA